MTAATRQFAEALEFDSSSVIDVNPHVRVDLYNTRQVEAVGDQLPFGAFIRLNGQKELSQC